MGFRRLRSRSLDLDESELLEPESESEPESELEPELESELEPELSESEPEAEDELLCRQLAKSN